MITIDDLNFTKDPTRFGKDKVYICDDPILPGIDWKFSKDLSGKWGAYSKGYFSDDFETLKACKLWLVDYINERKAVSIGDGGKENYVYFPTRAISQISIGDLVEYRHRDLYEVVNIVVCQDHNAYFYCIDEYNCPHVISIYEITDVS